MSPKGGLAYPFVWTAKRLAGGSPGEVDENRCDSHHFFSVIRCTVKRGASRCFSVVWGALVLGSTTAVAEGLPVSSGFSYRAGLTAPIVSQDVYAAWNPNGKDGVLRPGLKVLFFGEGDGCKRGVANGPVTDIGNPNFTNVSALTGIAMALPGAGQRWTPSANTPDCEETRSSNVGDSFVHVNEDPAIGGMGLFTMTEGMVSDSEKSFFRSIGASGRKGGGVNPHIEGTFVGFRFSWQHESSIRPWKGEKGIDSERTAELYTVQSVITARIGEEGITPKGRVVQAKQQVTVTFINPSCFKAMGSSKRLCQVQYLFNIAVYRSGVTDWNQVPWFRSAGVFSDPGQGGMPVVHGPLRHDQGGVGASGSGLPLYSSVGAPSKHETFDDMTFRVQITFTQFKNALREIAAKAFRKNPEQISHAEIRSLYGRRWDDTSEWVLLSINVGQEVYNPTERSLALIGGNVRELRFGSIDESMMVD